MRFAECKHNTKRERETKKKFSSKIKKFHREPEPTARSLFLELENAVAFRGRLSPTEGTPAAGAILLNIAVPGRAPPVRCALGAIPPRNAFGDGATRDLALVAVGTVRIT